MTEVVKVRPVDAHKYKCGGEGYRTLVYCEYCGQVAFYANRSDYSFEKLQAEAKEPCPRVPR